MTNLPSSDLATQHSAETDITDLIPISEKPINLYPNQIIFQKSAEYKIETTKIFKRNRIKIYDINFTVETANKILNLIEPGKLTAIKIDDDTDFALFQNKYLEKGITLKIIKANKFIIDVENDADLREIILREHLRLNHRGINALFHELKEEYFFPKLKINISRVVNNCHTCNITKYDRIPLKLPLKNRKYKKSKFHKFSADETN